MNKIQTLHPEKGKKNKNIPADKYQYVKTAILEVLRENEVTHTQLVEGLVKKLGNNLKGENISWYTMVVKLDLEARGMIGRTGSKPQKYRIK